jgi:hypothetical protein
VVQPQCGQTSRRRRNLTPTMTWSAVNSTPVTLTPGRASSMLNAVVTRTVM